MKIVTGEPAPTVERDEAARLLLEMAAVVRTVLGAPARVAASAPTLAPPAPAPAPIAVALVAPPAPPPLAGLPVPNLALPLPADPEERRSLALLQEIAFLDE
jgi:hypothetical protein